MTAWNKQAAGVRPSPGAAMSESFSSLKLPAVGRQIVAVAWDGHTPHFESTA
jgi:hypothetical protein